jgi:hypothetical protein
MEGFGTEERRFRLVTVWVCAKDVRRALGCSRSLAYEHLRRRRPVNRTFPA